MTHRNLWPIKEAIKDAGAGRPGTGPTAMYKRLREKGLFLYVAMEQKYRNLPSSALQNNHMFVVQEHQFEDKVNNKYRPCPKVFATTTGKILLQEIADELAQEKEESASKRSRVHGGDNGDQRPGEVLREVPSQAAAVHGRQ